MTNRFLVFTDLDGTLLDHDSYGVRMSIPGVDLLSRRKCPVIPVSSKTSAEIRQWMRILFLNGPYICENGCGIVIPKTYLGKRPHGGEDDGSEWKINLGMSIGEVRKRLREVSVEAGITYRGFEQMSDEEISDHTGLSGGEINLCRQREYDEPFIIETEREARIFRKSAAVKGLVVTRGGRFFHATGGCDKGKAVRILADILLEDAPDIQTVAVGDSLNDLAMFQAVDRAYLVERPDESHDPEIPETAAVRIHAVGPKGFRAVVQEIMTVG
jgi:mannosyl-3-phosphoglycerate phosphatase